MNGPGHVGVHLDPRGSGPSAVAALDDDGRLAGLTIAGADAEVLAALPPAPAAIAIDAALAIPNDSGRRDLERVLAWCDVNLFPISARRMVAVFGSARGLALAPVLRERADLVAEGAPGLVLRELIWERAHPPASPPLALAEYRGLWLAARPPEHAPRRGGAVDPAGLRAAADLLAGVIDLCGWTPDADGDRHADSARIAALACAYAALRRARLEFGPSLDLGTAERGRLITPADANLIARAELHLERLRASGEIAI